MSSWSRSCTGWILSLRTRISIFIVWVLFAANGHSEKPVCRNNDHVNGEWTLNPLSTPSFACCPTFSDDQTLIRDNNATWYNSNCKLGRSGISYSEAGVVGVNIPVGRGCTCDLTEQRENGLSVPSLRARYRWDPTNCRLQTFHAHNFCKLLGLRKILLIGDSTMEQCSSTLLSILGLANAPCAPLIVYERSDYLVMPRFGKEFTLYDNVLKHKPQIVVMTVGAWLQDQGDMISILTSAKSQIASIRQQLPNEKIQFVFKTQNPGHVQCNLFQKPISWAYERENNFSTRPSQYHWNEHVGFDAYAREIARQEQWVLLDMSPLYLRPDAHPFHLNDCLHYCLPGPVDLFAILLHHKMHVSEI